MAVSWPSEMSEHRVSDIGFACSVDPMVAEAVHHLVSARLSLGRFATGRESPTDGREFLQIEEAVRAIHTALVAIRGCSSAD